MKLYILAERLKKTVDEVLRASKKLKLEIKSSEQKLTHDQVIELTKYFSEKNTLEILPLSFIKAKSPQSPNR